MVYNRIMDKIGKSLETIENIIIKDILTPEDREGIYSIINSATEEQEKVIERLGHKVYLLPLEETLVRRLEKIVQGLYGEDWVVKDYQFARYSLEYGYVPKLYPHFDQAFDTHRLTLDVQVSGTRDWPIVVEGRSRVLDDGDALIFSGTSQIHWRDNLTFENDDRFDMIFFHFHNTKKPDSFISDEWKSYMMEKWSEWEKVVHIERQPQKIEGNHGK